MKSSILLSQLQKKSIHYNFRGNYFNKRKIFIGPPSSIPKKIPFYVLGLSFGLLSTNFSVNSQEKDSLRRENNQKLLSRQQAHDIILSHTIGFRQPQLLDAAIVLGYYDCHAKNESTFFRGEKISLSVIQNIEEKLNQILELKEHTPITSSLDTASNFTNAPFLLEAINIILDKINIISDQDKKKPVFYNVNVPEDISFIKIPNNTYSGIFDEISTPYNESEFVLPKGTLIKITKNTEEDDTKILRYTIHVLSNDEVKAYYEKNTTDKKE